MSTSTGTGGVDAIPLVTKGHGGSRGRHRRHELLPRHPRSRTTCSSATSRRARQAPPGLNHPIAGIDAIAIVRRSRPTPLASRGRHVRRHDLRLYLDGNLETSLVVGQPPRADSIQHAATGHALNSTSTSASRPGFFAGVAGRGADLELRPQRAAQITSGKTREIPAAPGLLGRWGFNESCGRVHDSSGNNRHGTMSGADWTWVAGAPFTGAPERRRRSSTRRGSDRCAAGVAARWRARSPTTASAAAGRDDVEQDERPRHGDVRHAERARRHVGRFSAAGTYVLR